jgi:uncharacterized phage protein gp47/JayE
MRTVKIGLERVFRRRRRLERWALEVAGVSGLVVASWYRIDPFVGVTLASVYAIVVANTGGGGNAGTR